MSLDRPAAAGAGIAPSTKWSLYAGAYAFFCGAVLLVPLGFVARTLVTILALPPALTALVVPASGAVVGAGVWWAVVERRGAYTYPFGGAAGVATAVLTVLFWVLALAVVWGPRAVLMGGLVVGFVLVVAAPVAFVAGMPLMYARRRLDPQLSDVG